jgi:hypothetical protein
MKEKSCRRKVEKESSGSQSIKIRIKSASFSN